MEWILKLIEEHTKDGEINQEELQKAINKEFPKHAVPKAQYNTLAETKVKLEEDLVERDKQLEGLKEIDAEGLKKQIETLQEENRIAKEDYEKGLKDIQLSSAIKLALNGKVHDEDIVSQLIKKDELVLSEEGQVVGLDAQIEKLKEDKSFLFVEEEPKPDDKGGFQRIGNPRQQDKGQGVDDAIAAAFGNLED